MEKTKKISEITSVEYCGMVGKNNLHKYRLGLDDLNGEILTFYQKKVDLKEGDLIEYYHEHNEKHDFIKIWGVRVLNAGNNDKPANSERYYKDDLLKIISISSNIMQTFGEISPLYLSQYSSACFEIAQQMAHKIFAEKLDHYYYTIKIYLYMNETIRKIDLNIIELNNNTDKIIDRYIEFHKMYFRDVADRYERYKIISNK